MKKFKHLDYSKRQQIERMLKKKYTPYEISSCLDVALSTIYLEIKRGTCEQLKSDLTKVMEYKADLAQYKYEANLKKKGRRAKLERDQKLNKHIYSLIKDKRYSPKAIIYELVNGGINFNENIKSYTTIYSAIKKGLIPGIKRKDLPRGKYKVRLPKDKNHKRNIPGKSIEERPLEVNERKIFGHWEMDCVLGKQDNKKVALVFTERKTRYEIIEKLKYHTTDEVVKALNRIEKRYKSSFYTVFKSITVDNGHEFMDCSAMEKALYRKGKRTEIYYCHPNSPGERGSNENCNLLVRRFLHKGMDFDKYLTTSKAKEVQEWINTYPRGIHSGKTAKELFINELINLEIAHYYRC